MMNHIVPEKFPGELADMYIPPQSTPIRTLKWLFGKRHARKNVRHPDEKKIAPLNIDDGNDSTVPMNDNGQWMATGQMPVSGSFRECESALAPYQTAVVDGMRFQSASTRVDTERSLAHKDSSVARDLRAKVDGRCPRVEVFDFGWTRPQDMEKARHSWARVTKKEQYEALTMAGVITALFCAVLITLCFVSDNTLNNPAFMGLFVFGTTITVTSVICSTAFLFDRRKNKDIKSLVDKHVNPYGRRCLAWRQSSSCRNYLQAVKDSPVPVILKGDVARLDAMLARDAVEHKAQNKGQGFGAELFL